MTVPHDTATTAPTIAFALWFPGRRQRLMPRTEVEMRERPEWERDPIEDADDPEDPDDDAR